MTQSLAIDGKYIWVGGMGAVFESIESRRIDFGEVRYIEGYLFKAFMVSRGRWFSYKVGWNFVDEDKNDVAFIREFKKRLFCFD